MGRWSLTDAGHGVAGSISNTLALRDGHALKDKTRNLRTALERRGKAVPVHLRCVQAVKGS